MRVVHVTDIHLRRFWSGGYDRLIRILEDDPPELLLITGDFVDGKLDHRPALPVLERLIPQLRAKHGVYGIIGNHDGDLIRARLGSLGVRFIEHQFVRLPIDDVGEIELVGLPGVKRYDFDPAFVAKVPPRRAGVPRLILGHYPDFARFVAPLQADAMFVGHTHGGQICLPNGYPPMTHDKLPHRMARGVHQFGNTRLFVNRGFGTTRWPIRLFCPAEVIEIRLC
jgi:predicted MPP superfamily phosphohydrolase